MSDDRRRVLDLLAQGKVTVEEAEKLLSAVGTGSTGPSTDPPRYFRIEVHQQAKGDRKEEHVNIRVPLSIVRGGMKLGAFIPAFGDRVKQRLRDRGIDLDLAKLDSGQLETLVKDLGELTIDVDGGDSQVRIRCE